MYPKTLFELLRSADTRSQGRVQFGLEAVDAMGKEHVSMLRLVIVILVIATIIIKQP